MGLDNFCASFRSCCDLICLNTLTTTKTPINIQVTEIRLKFSPVKEQVSRDNFTCGFEFRAGHVYLWSSRFVHLSPTYRYFTCFAVFV